MEFEYCIASQMQQGMKIYCTFICMHENHKSELILTCMTVYLPTLLESEGERQPREKTDFKNHKN